MAALPLIGVVAKAACILPESPVKPSSLPAMQYDYYPIMLPHEMPSYGFIHFPFPSGLIDGNPCSVRTYVLKMYSDGIPDMNNLAFRKECQKEAAFEIHRLGITHLYVVGFNPCYVITPDSNYRYKGFFRGINAKGII
jgi:hypothetical protein